MVSKSILLGLYGFQWVFMDSRSIFMDFDQNRVGIYDNRRLGGDFHESQGDFDRHRQKST